MFSFKLLDIFHFFLVFFISFCVFASDSVKAEDKTTYFRLGSGLALSADTEFFDVDCQTNSPVPLFGCFSGNDGRSIGAYGDFGDSVVVDMGFGYNWNEWLRTEIMLSYRPGFEFEGRSNFSQVDTNFVQTVEAEVQSFSGLFVGIVRPLVLFQVEKQKIEPFLLGGFGGVYNSVDSMEYTFPATRTITPDGSHSDFAWTVGAGISYEITEKIGLDFTYRYINLGKVTTDVDPITIIRLSNNAVITDSIVINETEADFEVNEVLLSISYFF